MPDLLELDGQRRGGAAVKALVIAAVLALCACASGVKMSEDEAAACRQSGCTVWTEAELTQLITQAFRAGYLRARESAGRAL